MVGMESDEYNIYEDLQLEALSLAGALGFVSKGDDGDEKEGDEKSDDAESPVEEIPPPANLVATISSGKSDIIAR